MTPLDLLKIHNFLATVHLFPKTENLGKNSLLPAAEAYMLCSSVHKGHTRLTTQVPFPLNTVFSFHYICATNTMQYLLQ